MLKDKNVLNNFYSRCDTGNFLYLWFSHMSSGVSPVGIVRIIVVLLHESLVSDSCDEEPEGNSDAYSLPHGVGNLVPHLLVKQVDLLKSSNVVFLAWSVSEAPDSKIVHMSHLGPGVLEFDSVGRDKFILEDGLLVVSGWHEHLLETLGSCFHVF